MILRLLLPLLLLTACGGSEPDAPSAQTVAAPTLKDNLRPKKQARLIDFKLPPTSRIAIEHNALIDRAIINQYYVVLDNEGYFYETLKAGEYDNFQTGDIVTATYEAYYLDGTLVDKSKPGKPLRFVVGSLIDAWNLGITRAKPGGSIRILTPSRLAYGAEGLVSSNGDTIVGANRPLEFIIKNLELLEE